MKKEDLLALLVNRLSSDFVITDIGHGWSNNVITVKSNGCNKVVLPENVINTIISLKGHKCMCWGG